MLRKRSEVADCSLDAAYLFGAKCAHSAKLRQVVGCYFKGVRARLPNLRNIGNERAVLGSCGVCDFKTLGKRIKGYPNVLSRIISADNLSARHNRVKGGQALLPINYGEARSLVLSVRTNPL